MTRDSGSGPAGRDVKQARGEAPQSGHEVASPEPHRNPSSTPPPDPLPCPFCGEQITEWLYSGRAGEKFWRHPLNDCILYGKRFAECASDQWNARSNQEATPDAELPCESGLVDRLCDLHRRLTNCWDQGTGKPKLRRPKLFTPQCADKGVVLDAAIAIERIIAKPVQEATRTVGDAERDAILEEAAEVVENSTSWGLSPTKLVAVHSFQAFAAKAIRAQKSDSNERLSHTSSCGGI